MPAGVELGFHVPHNTYLEVGVEVGLVGLALFLAIFFFTLLNLSRLSRAAKRCGDTFTYTFSTAIGNGVVGYAIAAFFVSGMHARVFWFSVFLSTCLPAFLTKAPLKATGSGASSVTDAEVRETAPLATPEQQPTAVTVAPSIADDVELRVDQLRIH